MCLYVQDLLVSIRVDRFNTLVSSLLRYLLLIWIYEKWVLPIPINYTVGTWRVKSTRFAGLSEFLSLVFYAMRC